MELVNVNTPIRLSADIRYLLNTRCCVSGCQGLYALFEHEGQQLLACDVCETPLKDEIQDLFRN